MNQGLLSLFGPGSSGAGRWLQGLLSAQPAPAPGLSVPGNKFYPGYSFGSMSYPILQRLGIVPQGGLPPGAQMQQGRAQGLLAPAQPAPAPQAPANAGGGMDANQQAALAYMARQQLRGLDMMNANWGVLNSVANGGARGEGTGR